MGQRELQGSLSLGTHAVACCPDACLAPSPAVSGICVWPRRGLEIRPSPGEQQHMIRVTCSSLWWQWPWNLHRDSGRQKLLTFRDHSNSFTEIPHSETTQTHSETSHSLRLFIHRDPSHSPHRDTSTHSHVHRDHTHTQVHSRTPIQAQIRSLMGSVCPLTQCVHTRVHSQIPTYELVPNSQVCTHV